jgi:eukaryotic translation initiation factor 2C
MIIGMDVSKPSPKEENAQSAVAIVASFDSFFASYMTKFIQLPGRVEVIGNGHLVEAFHELLETFRAKAKGAMPKKIVIFRDGVSEGEYEQVVAQEIPQLKTAIQLCGFTEEYCKITLIICQKRHKNRVAMFDPASPTVPLNPPAGLLHASHDPISFLSANWNEFLLYSHTCGMGTSKGCKYTLLYDEVGFQMAELYLVAYWLSYLYGRCNKSVSLVTPAYYAHLASKRCALLISQGKDVGRVSSDWMKSEFPMFYL